MNQRQDDAAPRAGGSERPAEPTVKGRFQGCLLGGAVGDALGAPVEFLTRREILRRFGPEGITGYAPAWGGLGTITDDTQMTLFTAEGLIRAWVRERVTGTTSAVGVTAHAYLRWLRTQGERPHRAIDTGTVETGWYIPASRKPGMTAAA